MSHTVQSEQSGTGRAERSGLSGLWLYMLILGILLIVVGLAAMSYPLLATAATVQVLGALFLIGGGVAMANAILSRRWRGFFLHLLAGILYAVLGVVFLDRPLGSAGAFTLMIAAALVIGGIFRIVVAALERFHGWMWLLINGVVSLVLGVMIWRDWPDSAFWVIGLFVGIEMVFAGLSWVMTGLALRGLSAN
ncbi:MAG: HdeD family acid-resistance protein [Gemmataceae bacterium]